MSCHFFFRGSHYVFWKSASAKHELLIFMECLYFPLYLDESEEPVLYRRIFWHKSQSANRWQKTLKQTPAKIWLQSSTRLISLLPLSSLPLSHMCFWCLLGSFRVILLPVIYPLLCTEMVTTVLFMWTVTKKSINIYQQNFGRKRLWNCRKFISIKSRRKGKMVHFEYWFISVSSVFE